MEHLLITNAWLCDDAIVSNGKEVWYLLDANGNMVSQGLVQDQTGNFYSLETNHNGFYGMLRHVSGVYDGVNLDLESSHGGAFAAIKNQDGISNLNSKYGVTTVNINNGNAVYTSNFKTASNDYSGQSGTSSGVSKTDPTDSSVLIGEPDGWQPGTPAGSGTSSAPGTNHPNAWNY